LPFLLRWHFAVFDQETKSDALVKVEVSHVRHASGNETNTVSILFVEVLHRPFPRDSVLFGCRLR
jgi:superfamily I DNA and RNA helicase